MAEWPFIFDGEPRVNQPPDPFMYEHDEEDEVSWDCDRDLPLEVDDDGESEEA